MDVTVAHITARPLHDFDIIATLLFWKPELPLQDVKLHTTALETA